MEGLDQTPVIARKENEEPGSSRGKLRSAPRAGGWHDVSHARPGLRQHDESQSLATPSTPFVDANNTTIGGTNPEENNVIAGNLVQGIWIDTAGIGKAIEGNQIGMIGPSDNGHYFQLGNGADGVLLDGSSDAIGGSGNAAGNLISGNGGDGIQSRCGF